MNVLGRVKDGAIAANSEIYSEESKVKGAAMPDEGHDADQGYDEQQSIEQQVYGPGESAREGADRWWQRGRRVAPAPPESCDEQAPNEQSRQRMNIYPE